ncbi:MAG TPA: amidase [Candidatus Limnocylindria bacterium]|nr:amidase [Candidatus Limnocylindria bacterium]
MGAYRYRSVSDLATDLKEKRISAVELADVAVAALGEIGPRYNAIASLLPERAHQDAIAADRLLARLDDPPILCGIPYGAKDLFAARGGPTTWGSAEFADQTFATDATAIRRLTRRGAVLAAKLAMSEFAGGGKPVAPGASMHGQGRNPWNTAHYSGGSSSGSGIAVAAGLVPYALGTETGGSTIGPAAFSGITGLRPTVGLIPRAGAFELSWSLDKVGILARSAEEIATVLDAIGARQTTSRTDVARLRVAVGPHELDEAAPGIRTALEHGFETLRRVVPNLITTEMDRTAPYIQALEEIVRVEGGFGLRDHLRRSDFRMSDERQLATLRAGLESPAADYLEAVRVLMPTARRAFEAVFAETDLIASASRTDIAPRLDTERPPRDATKLSDLLRAAGNLAGVPGVSIPCGLSDDGMPVALQLIGPRGSDGLLLAVASAFQRESDDHLRRPPELVN